MHRADRELATIAAGAHWETTLPAPEYLEVGLEAILPKVHERLASMVATSKG